MILSSIPGCRQFSGFNGAHVIDRAAVCACGHKENPVRGLHVFFVKSVPFVYEPGIAIRPCGNSPNMV
jgi:hypothetical protein